MSIEREIEDAIRRTTEGLKCPLYCGHAAANLGYVDAQRQAEVECKVCKEIAGLKAQLKAAREATRGVSVEMVFAWADRLDNIHRLLANEMRQAARYADPVVVTVPIAPGINVELSSRKGEP